MCNFCLRSIRGALAAPKKIALVLFAVLFSRVAWLTQMEYNADEQDTSQLLGRILDLPFNPLAPTSYHSGISHSSGFLYFVSSMTLGSDDPVIQVLAIAIFNALAIAIPLWVLRSHAKYALTFAMCGTSLALIVNSRKIWVPNMIAPWDCLAIALFAGSSLVQSKLKSHVLLILSGLCLVLAGHMYLPGGLVAGLVMVGVTLGFMINGQRKNIIPWLTGCALGWLSFTPYLAALIPTLQGGVLPPGSSAHKMDFAFVRDVLTHLLVLPSSYGAYKLYLKPIIDHQLPERHELSFLVTQALICLSIILWIILYWLSLANAYRRRKDVCRDPLALASVFLLIFFPAGLIAVKLGDYLHYWLGVFPFVFYLIAFACAAQESLRRFAWICCFIGAMATFQFGVFIITHEGHVGGYGPSYASLLKAN
jgi:hypothetical protein